MIKNSKSTTIIQAIKAIRDIYRKRGFRITHILMDGQFEPIRGELGGLHITLNTVANDEHVPEVERYIRTIKDRTRSIYNSLPFTRMPAMMIVEMVYYSVFWLNSFPALDGVSRTLSPRAIVTGSTVSYEKHCRLEFGSYVQTHEEHDNSMVPRTTGAIALRPSGNAQGGHYFLSLLTGRRLHRNRWTELPMPADVIDRVHVLARRSRADRAGIEFGNRYRDAIPGDNDSVSSDDDVDDMSYYESEPDTDDDADDADEDDDDHDMPGNNYVDDIHVPAGNIDAVPIAGVFDNNNLDDVPLAGVDEDNNNADNHGNDNTDNEDNINNPPANAENIEPVVAGNNEIEQIDQNIVDDDMNQRYGERLGAYNLRPRRPRDYSHLHTTMENIVMTQHTLKKGIKVFGEAGVQAVLKELQQLHDRKVLEPKHVDTLSPDERDKALQYLMFLKFLWQDQGPWMC